MNSFVSPKTILQEHDIYPSKHLGQNFLVDEEALQELLRAAELSADDTVLEVGGGVGTVTRQVAERVAHVVTVEKDKRLVPIFREQTKEFNNIEIIEGDILNVSKSYKLKAKSYKLLGTPPYYLTARLFRTFLEEASQRPALIALIIQKEVAQKICAEPPDMSLLALSVQLFGEPKIVREVSQNAFWPQPEVDSSLLVVRVYAKPRIEKNHIKIFFRLAKITFAHPRQQLQKTLSKGLHIPREQILAKLAEASIEPRRRPETLSIEEWKKLLRLFG